jgi:hypothetical protein
MQDAQNIGLVDTIFEELVGEKSIIETYNFLRSYAIRNDQQNKKNATRQIQSIN